MLPSGREVEPRVSPKTGVTLRFKSESQNEQLLDDAPRARDATIVVDYSATDDSDSAFGVTSSTTSTSSILVGRRSR